MLIIDILSLYFLTQFNGKLALRKGLKPMSWKINTIVAWIVGEIVGFSVALKYFNIPLTLQPLSNDQVLRISLLAYPFAFAGFHFIKYTLEKKPDMGADNSQQEHF
jgi:hypothetical protein